MEFLCLWSIFGLMFSFFFILCVKNCLIIKLHFKNTHIQHKPCSAPFSQWYPRDPSQDNTRIENGWVEICQKCLPSDSSCEPGWVLLCWCLHKNHCSFTIISLHVILLPSLQCISHYSHRKWGFHSTFLLEIYCWDCSSCIPPATFSPIFGISAF